MRRNRTTSIRTGFLLILSIAFLQCRSRAEECRFSYFQYTFDFRGSKVLTEVYQPDRSGRFPLVFMIHGSAGLYTRDSAAMPERDNFGEKAIAANCFVVALVHYFDSAGIASTQDLHFLETHSALWLDCLRAGLDSVKRIPKADDKRIGLFGESLGGFLTAELASGSRIAAVSVISAGMLPGMRRKCRKPLVPIQIQHGEEDSVVPLAAALELRRFWEANGGSVEFHILEGGHYLSASTRDAVTQRAIEFFRRTLHK